MKTIKTFKAKVNKKRSKKHLLNVQISKQLYAMCALPLFYIILFSYVPMVGLILAFKKFKYNMGVFGSPWIGFKNFEFFFRSNDFWVITWNTLSMNFLFIVFGTLAAIVVALLFYELRRKTTIKILQTILITPHFLSWVVVAYMVYAILQPQYGFLNKILAVFNISPVDWYATPSAWPYILIIANIWKHVGMDCIIYYASLIGIDNSLTEAARVDGATKMQTIMHIIIPQLLILISIMVIIKIGSIFRADFGLFYQLPMDAPQLYSVTDVVDTYLYRTLKQSSNIGLSTAIGLLQSCVGFVLVILTNYFSKKIDEDMGLL